MARQRIIRPEFFSDERLAACPPHARLLFAGLWGLADKRGRLRDKPPVIHGAVFPFEPELNIGSLLDDLQHAGSILRYEAEGKNYIQVKNFERFQKPHPKEAESTYPAPPLLYRARPRKATDEPGGIRSFVPSVPVPDPVPDTAPPVPESGDHRPGPGEGSAAVDVGEVSPNGNGHDQTPEPDAPERLDPGGLLDAAKVRMAGVLPAHAFATWIRPLQTAGWDGDVFVIVAPSVQHRDWVTANHAKRIKAAFHELGHDCLIRISARVRAPATLHDGAL